MLGWDPAIVQREVSADLLQSLKPGSKPEPFNTYPPGVLPRPSDLEPLRAGLCVQLIAQDERVGLMIVHTTLKPRFSPGELALLQTFANQAAVAIQRAGLIEQLRSKIDQLEAAQVELASKERMEREMELARQVQQSVLPHTFPEISGYRFAALNEPARQVGGDFYDVIWLDADHFGIAIADVSDKGMPAALYMALTRSLLRAEARRERSPSVVVSNVNQLLLELGEPDMFVSIFYGVVERTTRRLTYVCAGHDRPVLLRADTAQFLSGRGLPLGILVPDDFKLAEEHLVLLPQDRLILYTDGLTDAVAPDGQLYDRLQLKSLLQRCASLSPDEICTSVFSGLAEFQGTAEQYDDMTLLVMAVES
jgi:sigma-B regulation protein RsbU (phosphoserine phosphatase)